MNSYRYRNAKNPHQGEDRKVLALCSAGLLRSPTIANVLIQEYGFNVRAAGVDDEFALIVADKVLYHWADEFVFADRETADRVLHYVAAFPDKPYQVLNLPDEFEYNDPVLRRIVKSRYDPENTTTWNVATGKTV